MIRRVGIDAALAAIALMLGACSYTYSINPLSAPGDSEADTRLEGIWQGECPAGDCVAYTLVVLLDNGLMDVQFVGYRYKAILDSSPFRWGRYQVFRTEIDGAQYLNVMPVAGKADIEREGPLYFIFKYDISQDGVWTIWLPSGEALRTLHRDIEEGKLAGMKRDGDFIVTDDAANLREYIRWEEDPFTERFVTLRKILPKVPGR